MEDEKQQDPDGEGPDNGFVWAGRRARHGCLCHRQSGTVLEAMGEATFEQRHNGREPILQTAEDALTGCM